MVQGVYHGRSSDTLETEGHVRDTGPSSSSSEAVAVVVVNPNPSSRHPGGHGHGTRARNSTNSKLGEFEATLKLTGFDTAIDSMSAKITACNTGAVVLSGGTLVAP